MNTKTMRLPPRRVLTLSNNNNKRKEGDGDLTPSAKLLKPTQPPTTTTTTTTSTDKCSSQQPAPPPSSNQLLAGYLAHEFLTNGTLFGQPWDPARAEAASTVASPTTESLKRVKPSQKEEAEEPDDENRRKRRYREVSSLLRTDGAHLPGIINPAQLARFLQM